MNNYKKIILQNGVTLYLFNDKKLKQTFVSYSINYGSSGKWFDFEYDKTKYHVGPGYAHFLEHLLGEHSKYGDIYYKFSNNNYKQNGITSLNSTCYYFYGIKNIKESIRELIEAIDMPIFTEKDVEESKKAIIEEAKMSCDKNVLSLCNLLHRNLYSDFDYFHESLSTIGNEQTTNDINFELLKVCYDAFYYDENKTLLIAGNINEQEIINYVNEIYAKIPKHEKKLVEYNYKSLDVREKEATIERNVFNEFNGLGIKIKMPEGFGRKEMHYFNYIIYQKNLISSSDLMIKFMKNGVLESNIISSINLNKNTIDLVIIVNSFNFNLFISELLEALKEFKIDEQEFKLMKKVMIANEVRGSENEYNNFKNFTYKKEYSEDFLDIQFIRDLDYNRFNKYLAALNYDNYVVANMINSEEECLKKLKK